MGVLEKSGVVEQIKKTMLQIKYTVGVKKKRYASLANPCQPYEYSVQ